MALQGGRKVGASLSLVAPAHDLGLEGDRALIPDSEQSVVRRPPKRRNPPAHRASEAEGREIIHLAHSERIYSRSNGARSRAKRRRFSVKY